MNLNLTLGPLALFAFVASITPGPNNLLLMRSGARFGVRRSVPHMAGVQVGFQGLLVLSYLGVGALLLALPGGFTVLRWACFAYLLWLAFAILRDARPAAAAPVGAEAADLPATPTAQPMRFIEGVLFQLINAKAWMMTVTVASAFYGAAKTDAARHGRGRRHLPGHRRALHAGLEHLGRGHRACAEAPCRTPRLQLPDGRAGRSHRLLDAALRRCG